ncbi:helix-turn-helix domain-containing protein [Streptomyces sp. NPDC015131]|uniref:helix-turn-helix domain-containing protein n=1 Tax=Streptomyces sp. NPDC015131 TaxID=3364941 RepID=UPI0036F5A6E0
MRCFTDPENGWELVWRRPDPRLWPGVVQYRGYRLALREPRRRLEIPDGAVTLVLPFENRLLTSDVAAPTGPGGGPVRQPPVEHRTGLLSALRTGPTLGEHSGHLHGVEVAMTPWAAYTLFGMPMHEWAGRIVDPADLAGRRVGRLGEALACLPDWEGRFTLLDAELCRWWREGPEPSPRVVWAWNELRRTGGAVPIGRLAERTGWGWRQFDGHFRSQIGLPPKVVARILRLHRALRLLLGGTAGASAAALCGFSDQAHMSREVRRMTGFPPSRLLPARLPVPADPLFQDRIRGRVTSFGWPGP